MMKMINKIWYGAGAVRLLLALSVLSLLTGCIKRQLEIRPLNGDVSVLLEWEDESHPLSSRFLLYNEDGMLLKDVKNVSDVYKEVLPFGTYKVITFNEDAVNVEFDGLDNYGTAIVSAKSDENGYLLEPKNVFSTGTVNGTGDVIVMLNKPADFTITPKSMIRQVVFYFSVESQNEIKDVKGELKGVARSIYLSTGKPETSFSSSVLFEGECVSKASSIYVANVNVFNFLITEESPEGTNEVSITLSDIEGKIYTGTFDLTETIKEVIKENHGKIPIDVPVEVDIDVTGIEGFTAKVTPWDDTGSGFGDIDPE